MVPPKPDDDLPSNVHTELQLEGLPEECLSGNKERPLRHVDIKGNEFFYSLSPMQYSVGLILVVELLERFAFYGVYYTQTLYLTGVYDDDWNAGFTSVDAASFVSISTAVAYTTPFIGALLADSYLGDYKTILLGCLGFYVPGLSLLAMTSSPGFLGSEFNTTALSVALLGLWPLGTGIIKSVVNVFGARQFHPFLQSSMIESYYVNFYTSINIGALLGILILPNLARHYLTFSYSLPVVMLGTAVLLFAAWTPRYIIAKPAHSLFTRKKRNDNDFIPLSTMFSIS
jgi:dipeptide/tripeptide permease